MEILKKIKPSAEEEKKLLDTANAIMSKIKVGIPTLGGSAAKGTWLKGSNDIDIYIKFDNTKKDISKILKKELKKNFKNIETLHGSRDYFQFKSNGYMIEVIPILDIKEVKDAENITDISPFHVTWVKKHKGVDDEIRLAKAFCKANKIYGAESYIQGFSGYVLEILTIYYGSFKKLLEGIILWKDKEVIDPENFYKGHNVLKILNKSKTVSPLILIDPVDKNRNAAAGLNKKSFEKLRDIAASYLKNPSQEFFEEKKTTMKVLKEKAKGKKLILFEVEPLKKKKDVAGAKMVKCLAMMKKHFMINGFKVLEHGWEWDKKALFWFIFDKKILPAKTKHYGPPSTSEKRMEGFKKKWKKEKILSEKGIAYVIVDREYRLPEDFSKTLLKEDFVKDKVKKVKLKKL